MVDSPITFQYLESLDSVRRPVILKPDTDEIFSRTQVLSEVLVSLALGRDLVVPQPFAVDSWNFLITASAVLSARDRVFRTIHEGTQHPIRLHLYQAQSFREAFAKMIAAAGAPSERVFYSSLAPELAGDPLKAEEISKSILKEKPEALYHFLNGDGRVPPLKQVWEEFSLAKAGVGELVVKPKEPRAKASIAEGVRIIVRARADELHELHRLESRQGFDELRLALLQLLRAGEAAGAEGGGFARRSTLYTTQNWPGLDASAQEFLSSDAFTLVKEFVDTLYNLTVAQSIGLAQVACSTPVLGGTMSRAPEFDVAQESAVAAYESQVFPPGPSIPVEQDLADADEPNFYIAVSSSPRGMPGLVSDTESVDSVRGKALAVHMSDALEAVLGARADKAFGESVRTLNEALTGSDLSEVERALERHTTLVAKKLDGIAGVRQTSDVLTIGSELLVGAAGEYFYSQSFGLRTVMVASGVAVAAEMFKRSADKIRAQGDRTRWAQAFGEMVEVRRLERS